MKHSILTFFVTIFVACGLYAQNNPNTDNDRKNIELSTVHHPHPHYSDVSEPVVMYNTVTQELTITLDAVYYPEFTICLETEYTTLEYFCFSSVVCLPTSSLGSVVDIYIESDECGCWYGELDKAEFGGQLDI